MIDQLLPLAKGDYQRGLLTGKFSWSGSDLQGAAKKWSGKYRTHRINLFQRILQVYPTAYLEKGKLVLPPAQGAPCGGSC